MLASRLVSEFRKGRVDDGLVRTAQTDGFHAFGLAAAAGTRPSLLRHTLPLDDDFLRRAARQVAASPHAGKRLGREWSARACVIEARDGDDAWLTRVDLRPLDDACTKFVTRKFLPDGFARVSLVANVIRLYDRLAQLSRLPFKIVFKGGVMQRLVLLEFWQNLPVAARNDAIAYLAEHKVIGISDMDFEIVADACSDDAKHRLLVLDYVVLLWLQTQLAREIARGASGMLQVDWDRAAGGDELRAQLQEVVDGLEPAHPLHGATIDRVVVGGTVDAPPRGYRTRGGAAAPTPRRNLFVFDKEGQPHVAPADLVLRDMGVDDAHARARCGALYATSNSYLNEGATPQRPQHLPPLFHLSRIKHAFTLYYTTREGHRRCDRLAGELIDLSQADPRDSGHAWVVKELRGESPYRDYPLLGVPDVVLRSYTMRYFVLDYVLMLHRAEVPPWEVPKYGKRLLRYVAFFVAHVLSPTVARDHRTKLRALQALVAHTRSVHALNAPLHTGVAVVDDFAARERAFIARGAAAYVRALHDHLAFLVECVARADAWAPHSVDAFHLWHTDHVNA